MVVTRTAEENAALHAAEARQHEDAKAQLDDMLNQTRPKNLKQGITSGVGNIVGGAVGAVGIAVMAPVVGAQRGAQGGGIIGGTVGFAGGAVAGVVGGAVVAGTGAVAGVTQVVRGVRVIPAAISGRYLGCYWDENTGKWVESDLEKEAKNLESVPDDDEDILGEARLDADDKIEGEGTEGQVFDTHYYDILQVETTATQARIKRQYYVMAKQYHPDKVGKDDKESAAKFQEIAEAYQVLSDEQLRETYDKKGKEGLSPTRTSIAMNMPKLDPAILFAFLFGSDKFQDYVGTLAMATAASVADSDKVTLDHAKIIQKRRCTRLAISLAKRLDDLTNEFYKMDDEYWTNELNSLASASYGLNLLHVIGKVYTLAAEQFLGSIDSGLGMPNLAKWGKSEMAQLKRKIKQHKDKVNILKAGMTTQEIILKAQKDMEQCKTDEERQKVQAQLEEDIANSMLNVIWTTTVVDITVTLHETCQMVLFDKSVDKTIRKKRGFALTTLGKTFSSVQGAEGSEATNAKDLYEEAALAAMLDTVAKKEQATYNAPPTTETVPTTEE